MNQAKLYCNKIRAVMEGASFQATKGYITAQQLADVVKGIQEPFDAFISNLNHPEKHDDLVRTYSDGVDDLYRRYGVGNLVVSDELIESIYLAAQRHVLRVQKLSALIASNEPSTTFNYRWVSNGLNICTDMLSVCLKAIMAYSEKEALRDHFSARADITAIETTMKDTSDAIATLEIFMREHFKPL